MLKGSADGCLNHDGISTYLNPYLAEKINSASPIYDFQQIRLLAIMYSVKFENSVTNSVDPGQMASLI